MNGAPRLSIAIAEDNGGHRKLLRALLEQQLGHNVVCEVDNGQALVEAVGENEVDLVVLDLDMPVLDGLAAAEQITKLKKVPVILLSGHPDLNHVVVDREPIAICLTKPASVDALAKAIGTLFK